jgi:hypothetical protein
VDKELTRSGTALYRAGGDGEWLTRKTVETQIDSTGQVRLLVATAIVLMIALWGLHRLAIGDVPTTLHKSPWSIPTVAVITVVAGISLVRQIVDLISLRSTAYLGAARVRAARVVLSTVLYLLLALVIASQTQIDLTGIALSGAVTGVVIGIAAQASIANVIAGLVILFVRPFRTGQYVTVRAASFAGSEYSGEVGEISLFYTTLFAGSQEIRVPNSSMVTSVVTLRPQVLEVYLPVILSPAQWDRFSMADLSRDLTAALPPGRQVTAVVERMDATSVQVGVHASVANEEERSTLESAVLKVLNTRHDTEVTGPHLDMST